MLTSTQRDEIEAAIQNGSRSFPHSLNQCYQCIEKDDLPWIMALLKKYPSVTDVSIISDNMPPCEELGILNKFLQADTRIKTLTTTMNIASSLFEAIQNNTTLEQLHILSDFHANRRWSRVNIYSCLSNLLESIIDNPNSKINEFTYNCPSIEPVFDYMEQSIIDKIIQLIKQKPITSLSIDYIALSEQSTFKLLQAIINNNTSLQKMSLCGVFNVASLALLLKHTQEVKDLKLTIDSVQTTSITLSADPTELAIKYVELLEISKKNTVVFFRENITSFFAKVFTDEYAPRLFASALISELNKRKISFAIDTLNLVIPWNFEIHQDSSHYSPADLIADSSPIMSTAGPSTDDVPTSVLGPRTKGDDDEAPQSKRMKLS